MATEAKTEVKVEATASTKVTQLIVALVTATASVISRKRALAEGVRSEASRMGLDRKGATQMVALSWLDAYGLAKASENERKAFMLKSRPDVSKVITLAFPEKRAAIELQAAFAHNDKLGDKSPKANRIGENLLLEIARGNVTTKQALAGKKAKQDNSRLDSILSPSERIKNAFVGVLTTFKVGGKERLSAQEAREAFEAALAAYSPEKK